MCLFIYVYIFIFYIAVIKMYMYFYMLLSLANYKHFTTLLNCPPKCYFSAFVHLISLHR